MGSVPGEVFSVALRDSSPLASLTRTRTRTLIPNPNPHPHPHPHPHPNPNPNPNLTLTLTRSPLASPRGETERALYCPVAKVSTLTLTRLAP